jgi:hypothetical protein
VLKIGRLVWWPGTELNRRRQPFQGWSINNLRAILTENTRLTRERFGLHLDARRRFGLHADSTQTHAECGVWIASRAIDWRF